MNNTGSSLGQSGCIIGHGWIWITKWGLPKEQSLLAFDQEDSDKDMLTNNTAGQKMMTNSSSRTPVDLIYIDSKHIWTYFICVGFSLYCEYCYFYIAEWFSMCFSVLFVVYLGFDRNKVGSNQRLYTLLFGASLLKTQY